MWLYHVLDIGFTVFHCALIVFNVFGWVWKKTRLANLITLLLTGASWLLLGLVYQLGYCPLTDWHWQVKRQLGQGNLPVSYIKWLVDAPTGWDVSPFWTDVVTASVFALALFISITLNVRDFLK